MKFGLTAFVLLLTVITAETSRAQKPLKIVTYDSLGADSLNTFGTLNPEAAVGFANNSNATLVTEGDWIFAKFYHGSLTAVDFQAGAKIKIYWTRSVNDSSHAYFILRNYGENWAANDAAGGDTVFVKQSGVAPQVDTITVPRAGFNTVEVHREVPQSNPVYVDAIVLVQHGTLDSVGNTAGVNDPVTELYDFTCSPNPFPAAQGTTLSSRIVDEGYYMTPPDVKGSFVVTDLIGREVLSIDVRKQAHISVPSSGTYFVRYRVGDHWSGSPFRLVAE
jgi:hypothetical protein